MKKSSIYSLGLVSTIIFSTAVFAQGAFEGVRTFWTNVLSTLFGDLSTQAGQIALLKFLFFLVLAIAIYEIFSRLVGLRPLISAGIGALIGLATALLIPGGVLLAVFTAASAVVIVFLLALVFAPPTILTYIAVKRKNWVLNAGLALLWFVLWVIFNNAILALNNNTLPATFSTLYSFAWIIVLVVLAFTKGFHRTAAVAAGQTKWAKKFQSWTKEQLIGETLTIEHDLEEQTKALKSGYAAMGTAANFKSGFGDKAVLELGKIVALLKVEATKTTDAGIKGEIDLVVRAIEGTGGPFTGGIILSGPPRGGFLRWINYLNTNWGSTTVVSVDGTNNLNTAAGKTAEMTQATRGLVPALEQLEKYVKAINTQLAKNK